MDPSQIRWWNGSGTGCKPQVRISDLVARSGWSQRHVISRFRDQIGVKPKMAASVIRFERAATALSSRQFSPAELAVAYGYADQSHLTREFVRFAGDTPAAYAASFRQPVCGRTLPQAQRFEDCRNRPLLQERSVNWSRRDASSASGLRPSITGA